MQKVTIWVLKQEFNCCCKYFFVTICQQLNVFDSFFLCVYRFICTKLLRLDSHGKCAHIFLGISVVLTKRSNDRANDVSRLGLRRGMGLMSFRRLIRNPEHVADCLRIVVDSRSQNMAFLLLTCIDGIEHLLDAVRSHTNCRSNPQSESNTMQVEILLWPMVMQL